MKFSQRERMLASLVALLALTAWALPHTPQDESFHQFVDGRAWLGIPNAQNVLSNLPIALAGMAGLGLLVLRRLKTTGTAFTANLMLFFAGLIVTAACSAWYHAAPTGGNLVLDRMGLVLAYAGTLGLLAADKVSARAGWCLGALALAAGPASVLWWQATGNVAPYAVVQFGGMLLLLLAALFWREGSGPNWGWLLALYAAAKLCEMYDYEIYAWSGHVVAGHALKHLLAAGAGLAVIAPLMRWSQTAIKSRRRWRAAV
ncbi:MAG TPA: hypothetical protein VH105_24340 [Burkholderiales bacterium]|jgi:hypothetical protein|nr:hypothetical protein [Burkholderiales bacterium]